MIKSSKILYGICIILFFLFIRISDSLADNLTDEAAQLFDQWRSAVFQVRVIDLSTQEKSSTGSGFFIDPKGYAVTNYHVVSSYVNKPSNHKIEIINHAGDIQDLSLVYFDIVHDLAILTTKKASPLTLLLNQSDLSHGEKIFSMGNPHDLGMTIIEGTFNGLMKQSLDRRILFSGSLNPGMSGGPTLNHEGKIIGINVSTMNNDVSFLVPVEYLNALVAKIEQEPVLPNTNWDQLIENQLIENQDHFINTYLKQEWQTSKLGDAIIPGEISPYVKCWGGSKNRDEDLMIKAMTNCSTEDYIYVNDYFYTSYLDYRFSWHESKNLHFLRLYAHLQDDFPKINYLNNASKTDVERFKCQTDFVTMDNRVFKTALCSRRYKRFKKLYDVSLDFMSVDEYDRSLMGGLILEGVTKTKSQEFIKYFMEKIQWKN